jgi:hypothetical protein
MAIERNSPPLAAFVSHGVFPSARDLDEIRALIDDAKERLNDLRVTLWSRLSNRAAIRALKADLRALGSAEIIAREFVNVDVGGGRHPAPIEWPPLEDVGRTQLGVTLLDDWLAARHVQHSGQCTPAPEVRAPLSAALGKMNAKPVQSARNLRESAKARMKVRGDGRPVGFGNAGG